MTKKDEKFLKAKKEFLKELKKRARKKELTVYGNYQDDGSGCILFSGKTIEIKL